MIDTVLFDMGGTLEDIFIDDDSRQKSAQGVKDICANYGLIITDDIETMIPKIRAGWDAYGAYRDKTERELKPEEIWGDYVMPAFGFTFEQIKPLAEELAHMWEIIHYHRVLRPRVKEMLEGLKSLGMKLGIISNTASLYQVYEILEDYGIRDYFQDVTLSSVTGYRKPDGNIFKISLHQVRSEPSTCAYVGDTFSRDIVGAARAGFGATFHIYSKLTAMKDTAGHYDFEPTYSISDIYEVYSILAEQAAAEKAD